jgi:hypothetical protein
MARKAKASPEYYDAGVYYFRNRKTGDAYVGASIALKVRVNCRLTMIRLGSGGGDADRRFIDAFRGCTLADIEIRIIERVQIPTTEESKTVARLAGPGMTYLKTRERFWIADLRPSLNRNHVDPRVDTDVLPVGPPATAATEAL